jgi:hypothetical protein
MITTIKFWVLKHPPAAPDVQYIALCNLPADAVQAEWEHLTEAELEEWKLADLANGWVPLPPLATLATPVAVRSAQLRQWLIDNDKLAAVEAAFENPAYWPDEKARLKAKARWEYEVNVVRADPMVAALGQLLGLTSEQIDQAFIAAEQIP